MKRASNMDMGTDNEKAKWKGGKMKSCITKLPIDQMSIGWRLAFTSGVLQYVCTC
jgi:hypothetical protein